MSELFNFPRFKAFRLKLFHENSSAAVPLIRHEAARVVGWACGRSARVPEGRNPWEGSVSAGA